MQSFKSGVSNTATLTVAGARNIFQVPGWNNKFATAFFWSVSSVAEGIMDRRRTRHPKSFNDRLAQDAEEARTRAETLPPGPERDTLLKRARQADTAMHLSDWLSSPGLQPPK
jgi:hypothetical protein